MKKVRWYDNHQPQTLQGAVILMYLRTALTVFNLIGAQGPLPHIGSGSSFSILDLGFLLSLLLSVVILVLPAVCGVGISNEKKWAYRLAVAFAVIFLALILWSFVLPGFDLAALFNLSFLLDLAFAIVMVALLLHPHSRSYVRLWFR